MCKDQKQPQNEQNDIKNVKCTEELKKEALKEYSFRIPSKATLQLNTKVQNDKVAIEGRAYLLQPTPFVYSAVQFISFKSRAGSGSALASLELVAAQRMIAASRSLLIRLYNKSICRFRNACETAYLHVIYEEVWIN